MNNIQNEINLQTNRKITTKDLVITGMFTALISVLAQISIPTAPIPFTLVVFAIFLTGALLPPRYAFLSALAYLLLGTFGAPVFAGFNSGPGILFGATGGYIMAFPIMSTVTALFYQWFKKYKTFSLVVGMVISLILCYLLGTLWFSLYKKMDFYQALTICVFPFVLFDTIKIILAASVSSVIRKTLLKELRH